MIINPGNIRTWLYRSEFTTHQSESDIRAMIAAFSNKNKRLNLTGFMITNGKKVMQLLEGDSHSVERLRFAITHDERHRDIVSEVWELEEERAYPQWSMRAVDPMNYEAMFKEIQNAKYETIATNIARLTFDTTFAA